MLTQVEVLKRVVDMRKVYTEDWKRLAPFFPISQWEQLGVDTKGAACAHVAEDWTEEAIIKLLRVDVAEGFEQALNQRGVAADRLYSEVKRWLWVLDDSLMGYELYDYYGLPLFRAVAVKYQLPNPIGGDTGLESKYSMW